MQRASLVPISRYISNSSKPASSLRLLEVAAGTGRFHTFIKDNWPDMPSVLSDLSPFYLSKARENIEYWRAQTQGGKKIGGGPDGANVEYLQTAAEAIAAPDRSFDVVVCTYLFHELPEAVRRRAASEFHRVLKPGGLMVFNDSVQLGDRPEWDGTVGNFSNFNEPYYRCGVCCATVMHAIKQVREGPCHEGEGLYPHFLPYSYLGLCIVAGTTSPVTSAPSLRRLASSRI